LRQRSYDIRPIAPEFVKPLVKRNQNVFVDAEALDRKNMRFVSIKADDQPHLQSIRLRPFKSGRFDA
jgi:transposase